MGKRIKHVGIDVGHSFFHQQDIGWARTDNMSWNGNTVYSYSSELAVANFEKKVLEFRSGSYSMTTSNHQYNLRRAIPHDWQVVYYEDWWNWGDFKKEITSRLEKLKVDRKRLQTGISYFGQHQLVDPTIRQILIDCIALDKVNLFMEFLPTLHTYYWTPEELELYEIKTWAEEHEITGATKDKIKWYKDPVLKASKEQQYLLKVADRELNRLKLEGEVRQKQLEKLNKWFNHEYSGFLWNIPVHLRLSKDGTEVETTKGASVPIEHAKLLYLQLQRCKANNTEWVANGHSIHVGHYKVEKIAKLIATSSTQEEMYYVVCGCHQIFDREIDKFIKDNNLDW